MRNSKIDFIRPSMPSPLYICIDYIKIVHSNIYSNFGPFETSFRRKLELYTKNTSINFITTCSATLGIHLAIENIFSPSKDKPLVLMPSFTFASAACVCKSLGYKIVFYDINPVTLQPDIESAKSIIKDKHTQIAGIIYCNSFGVGHKENFKKWRYHAVSIPIIVDSAAGFGSRYEDGTSLCALGDCEVFSFHATKTMSVGEGGAISTTNKDLAKKLREASNFGFDSSRSSNKPGTNAKLQELSAAIGIRQLNKLNNNIATKSKNISKYRYLLDSSIKIQPGSERSSVAFLSLILPNEEVRRKCLEALIKDGIECRQYYYPLLSNQPMFKNEKLSSNLDGTRKASNLVLSVPVHHKLKNSDIKKICRTINLMV